MRVFFIKILMKRCFTDELREIIQHGERLIFQRGHLKKVRKDPL